MNQFATDFGYSVLALIATLVLLGVAFFAMVKVPGFAWACKIIFLAIWLGFVGIGPVVAIVLSRGSDSFVSTCIGAALALTVGLTSFWYLGFPELRRSLSGPR